MYACSTKRLNSPSFFKNSAVVSLELQEAELHPLAKLLCLQRFLRCLNDNIAVASSFGVGVALLIRVDCVEL